MKQFKKIGGKVLGLLFILFWIAFTILPILSIIPASLKSQKDFYKTDALSLSGNLTLDNYKEVLNSDKFIQSLFTTFSLILVSIIFTTLLSACVAYAIERYNFKYKSIITRVLFILAVIPMVVLQVHVYQTMNFLNLHNNIIGLAIIYSTLDIVMIYMFRGFINKIPSSVEKSARLCGASDMQIFFKIILPSLKEGIILVMIFKTITIYNDFYLQFLFLPTNTTVSTYLYTFIGNYRVSWPQICASIVLTIIPILVLIALANSFLKRNISTFDM